jgi:hypothetical protein
MVCEAIFFGGCAAVFVGGDEGNGKENGKKMVRKIICLIFFLVTIIDYFNNTILIPFF